MMHEDDEECVCVPQDAVVLRELHILEYMDGEGEIWKVDLSHNGSDGDLPLGDVLELAEWAKAVATAPMIADLVHSFIQAGEDDD